MAGLPELVVDGLTERDAGMLLDSVLTGPLDAQVRASILAETRGNPLALLELPRGLTPAELAGGFALPDVAPLVGADRGELPAAPRGSSGRDPARAAGRGGRSRRRPAAGVASRRAARHPGSSRDASDRGRTHRVRRPSAVSSSAGALGGLPVGVARGKARRAPRPGRGHRSGGRSRSPRLAPGPRRRRARRGCRRGARALGRPRAGPRGIGGGGRLPRAGGNADARTRSPWAAPPRGGQGEARRRRTRRGAGAAGGGRGWPARRPADRRGGTPARSDRV